MQEMYSKKIRGCNVLCAHGSHLSSTWYLPFMPSELHLLTLTSRFARAMVQAVASASCWHLSLSEVAFSNLAVSFPRFSLRRCTGKRKKNNSTFLRKTLLQRWFTLRAGLAQLHHNSRCPAWHPGCCPYTVLRHQEPVQSSDGLCYFTCL